MRMNKILAAISVVFAAGLLLGASPSAFAHGDKGCTPGYWKNNSDTNGAEEAGYLDLLLNDKVFDLTGKNLGAPADLTIGEALVLKGGGLNAVYRHAAAGVLNQIYGGIDYPADLFEEAIQKVLDENISGAIEKLDFINNLGCPIDAFGIPL
jgi:hypothetical protein